MKEHIYKIKKAIRVPLKRLDNVWWNFKLKTLCKYYGGGKNIPPAVLGRWCPLGTTNIDAACIGASEHIVAMEKFFGLKPNDDIALLYFSGFMYADSPTLRADLLGRRIALSTYPARQYFRCLYIHGNYQRKIKYLLSQPEKLAEFLELLNKQNKHLTLTISV